MTGKLGTLVTWAEGLIQLITPNSAQTLPVKSMGQWDDVPAYPPFQHGIPASVVEGVLASQQRLLDQIKDQLGYDTDTWESLILPILHRYVEIVHLLPASETHHHRGAGGLFRHGLETAFWAARSAESKIFTRATTPKTRRDEGRRWVLAAFVAGLLHDIGKPISDLSVTDKAGELEWNPHVPIVEWLNRHKLTHYYLHWNPERQHKRHETFSMLFLTHVVKDKAREYFLAHRELMDELLNVLIGNGEDSEFGRLIIWADRESTARDLKQQRISPDEYSYGVPVEKYIVESLRVIIGREEEYRPNTAPWHVIRAKQGLYLHWSKLIRSAISELKKDGVSGIPTNPDTLAKMLIERGYAEAHPAPDSERKDAYALYTRLRVGQDDLADENGEIHLETLEPQYLLIADPDLILSAIVEPTPMIAEPILKRREQADKGSDSPVIIPDDSNNATASDEALQENTPAPEGVRQADVSLAALEPHDDEEVPAWVLASEFAGAGNESLLANSAVSRGSEAVEFNDLLKEAGLPIQAYDTPEPDQQPVAPTDNATPSEDVVASATLEVVASPPQSASNVEAPVDTCSAFSTQKDSPLQAVEKAEESSEAGSVDELLADVSLFEKEKRRKKQASEKRLRKLQKRAERRPGDYSDIHYEQKLKEQRQIEQERQKTLEVERSQRRDRRVTIAPDPVLATTERRKPARLETLGPTPVEKAIAPSATKPHKKALRPTVISRDTQLKLATESITDPLTPESTTAEPEQGQLLKADQAVVDLSNLWQSFQSELQRRCVHQAMDEEIAQLIERLVRDILIGELPLGGIVWLNENRRILLTYPDAIQAYARGRLASKATRAITTQLERCGMVSPMKDHPPGQRPIQRDPETGRMAMALSNTINAIVRQLLENAEILVEARRDIPVLPTLQLMPNVKITSEDVETASAPPAPQAVPESVRQQTRTPATPGQGKPTKIGTLVDTIRRQILAGEGHLIMDAPTPVNDGREWRVQESILARAATTESSTSATVLRMHINMKKPLGLRHEGMHVFAAAETREQESGEPDNAA